MTRRALTLRLCCCALLAASVPAPARAQTEPETAAAPTDAQEDSRPAKVRAEEWFKAGAAAYAVRDYLAAIQALEAAYALTPFPPIAFSIAQALRKQYFVQRRPEHLVRSVALFRRYLEEDPNGSRRNDAIEALAQLEPLLAQANASATPAPGPADRSTRVMVLCDVPNARISVDGAEPLPSPLIREVTPGKHAVEVKAPGYRDSQRQVVAVQGELVPITMLLTELPSRLQLTMPDEAQAYVDGVLVSQGSSQVLLELPSGRHRVSIAGKGHKVATRSVLLGRGETGSETFQLEPTRQRLTSHVLFVGGAAALAAGGAFTFLALRAENDAQDFMARNRLGNVTPAELVRYNQDVATRNRYRWIAGGAFGASLGLLVTGLFLHELDTPGAEELYRPLPLPSSPLAASADRGSRRFDLGAYFAPGEFGASLRGEF
jgi:hypothetical protein